MAALATSMIGILAFSMVVLQVSGAKEGRGACEENRAVLAAEAGLSQSYMRLQKSQNGNLGAAGAPASLAGADVVVSTQTFGPTNNLVRVTSNATVDGSTAGAELVLKSNVTTMFRYAAFGDTSLGTSAQAKIDSYDSTLGTYASQNIHGSGSNSWANNKGNVGSNGNIAVGNNSLVFGDAAAGMTGTLTLTGSAQISGSTAKATSAFAFPPITCPTIGSAGNLTVSSNTTLAAGNYHYATSVLNNNKTLTLTGPSTIVFDSLELRAQAQLRVNGAGGEVNIYVKDNFILNSGTLIAATNYDTRKLHLNLLSDNIADPGIVIQLDTLTWSSNSMIYGTIYAPDAFVNISSNFEIFGSLIAEKIQLASNSRVHYDEALGRVLDPGVDPYSKVSWRVLH